MWDIRLINFVIAIIGAILCLVVLVAHQRRLGIEIRVLLTAVFVFYVCAGLKERQLRSRHIPPDWGAQLLTFALCWGIAALILMLVFHRRRATR